MLGGIKEVSLSLEKEKPNLLRSSKPCFQELVCNYLHAILTRQFLKQQSATVPEPTHQLTSHCWYQPVSFMGLGLGAVLIPVLQKIHVTNKPGTVSAVSTVVQIMPFSIFNEKHFSQLTLKSYSFLQGSPTSKSRYLLFSIGKKEARKKKRKKKATFWSFLLDQIPMLCRQGWRDESENLIQFTVCYYWQSQSADGLLRISLTAKQGKTPQNPCCLFWFCYIGIMLLVLPLKKIPWIGSSSLTHTHIKKQVQLWQKQQY